MDIRTKLVFALVFVALASMAALGWSMYGRTEAELRDRTLEQLEGLVRFKAESVEGIVAGWHDRVGLVSSRTQLRASLEEYTRTGAAPARTRIERILGDAFRASGLFRELRVEDTEGAPVAVIAEDDLSAVTAEVVLDASTGEHDPTGLSTRYWGVAFREEGPATVDFIAPLLLDERLLGYLHAAMVTEEIERLAENWEGLGETGETMVVVQDAAGVVRSLHPMRAAPPRRIGGDGLEMEEGAPDLSQFRRAGVVLPSDGPARAALIGDAVVRTEGWVDYRGEDVWAATGRVPETGWGIVVKIDDDELTAPVADFRRDTLNLAATLGAFAIFFGTVLGFRFAQPIHRLSEAAGLIRGGDLSARSGLEQEDEVGLLAKTFDEMADSLQDQVELLSEFRRFFEMSLDLLCIASVDGYFKRINPAFVRELGWSEEELLRKSFIDFVHPDDVEPTVREIEKLSQGEPTIRFTNRFLCMDGTYKSLRWNSFPEEGTGRLFAIARVRTTPTESET